MKDTNRIHRRRRATRATCMMCGSRRIHAIPRDDHATEIHCARCGTVDIIPARIIQATNTKGDA